MREVQGTGVASRSSGDLDAWPGAVLCLPALGGSLFCLQSGLSGVSPGAQGMAGVYPGLLSVSVLFGCTCAHVGASCMWPSSRLLTDSPAAVA